MPEASSKRCVVAYATLQHQYLWTVELPVGATVADALEVARSATATRTGGGTPEGAAQPHGPASVLPDIPWDTAPVGIYGVACTRQAVPADGDRIEIYRPLRSDPRDRRRERVERERKARRS